MTSHETTGRPAPDVSLSTPGDSDVTLALAYRDAEGTLRVLAEAPGGRLALHRDHDAPDP